MRRRGIAQRLSSSQSRDFSICFYSKVVATANVAQPISDSVSMRWYAWDSIDAQWGCLTPDSVDIVNSGRFARLNLSDSRVVPSRLANSRPNPDVYYSREMEDMAKFLFLYVFRRLLDKISRTVKVRLKDEPELILQIRDTPVENPQATVLRRHVDGWVYEVQVDVEADLESEEHERKITVRGGEVLLWTWWLPWRIWRVPLTMYYDPDADPTELRPFVPVSIAPLESKHLWMLFRGRLLGVRRIPRTVSCLLLLDFRGFRPLRRKLGLNWSNALIRGDLA